MTIAEKLIRAKADYDYVYNCGYTTGNLEGYFEGYDFGYHDGYEYGESNAFETVEHLNTELEQTLYGTDTGGKSYYDAFWDKLQTEGSRTGYSYAFYNSYWNNEITYKPKYPINIAVGINAFAYSTITDTVVPIDFTFATAPANNTHIFNGAWKLHTIRKLIVNEQTSYTTWFNNCTALKNITIEGTIGNDINFSACPLTVESALSVYDALADLSGTGKTATLTFSKVTKNLLDVPRYDSETGDRVDSIWEEMVGFSGEFGWIIQEAA